VRLKTVTVVTGELETNCYLLWREGGAEAVVFDPGDDAELIEAELTRHGLRPVAFFQTHCHFDHFGALPALKTQYPAALVYVPAQEAEWLQRPTLNLSYFFGTPLTGPKPDHLVKPDEKFQIAAVTLTSIHVPGHSPGGTAYFAGEPGEPGHLFAGDILMRGSIGRIDLPGGESEDALIGAIRGKLFVLPDETIVHPGHGPETTIGREKATNPFCGPR
jgi:hydroxyacylglutathione hydrolase